MSTVAEYTTGTVAAAGGSTSGTVTVTPRTGWDELQFPTNGTVDYAEWGFAAAYAYTIQAYLHTPDAWVSTEAFMRPQVTSGEYAARVCFTGAGNPGRIQLFAAAEGVVTVQSPQHTLAVDTTYRVLLTVDTTAPTMRLRVYNLGSDTPLWDSGEMAKASPAGVTRVRLGELGNLATLGTFGLSRIQVTDTAETLYRHASDMVRLDTPLVTLGVTTPDSGSGDGTQTITWDPVIAAASYDAYIAAGLGPSGTPTQEDFVLVAAGVTSPYAFTGMSAGRHAFGIKARV